MLIGTSQLSGDLRRALGKLERTLMKAAEQEEPAWVKLTHGLPGIGGDEVFVLVMGAPGTVVSRTKVIGRKPSLRDLKLRLAGAEAAVRGVSATPLVEQGAQLTESEASMLDSLGFPEQDPGEVGASERTRIDLEILLRDSLTLEQAGKLLHLSTGRLRQRLGPGARTLYGFKEGRAWRIPRFQVDRRGHLVRGIDKVIPRVRSDAHPLAVARWFTSPHQDLVVGVAEDPVTPLAWLAAGRNPGAVADLAQEI
jgi:hypothetical protein